VHEPALDYAGWWSRVGAYILDAILLFVLLIVVIVVGHAIGAGVLILLLCLWFLFGWLGYWVYFEGSESGQTIGKRALGIRVRNDRGGRASYGQAFGRNIVARLIGIIPFAGLADVLWPLWDGRHQCLHDKAASTVVVRA
jgi:uncharacterized RDD family membrane protein YckC